MNIFKPEFYYMDIYQPIGSVSDLYDVNEELYDTMRFAPAVNLSWSFPEFYSNKTDIYSFSKTYYEIMGRQLRTSLKRKKKACRQPPTKR